AKFATGGLNASVEFAKNFGEDRTLANNTQFKGYALQLKAGYKLDLSDVGMINPWGEWGMGSGDSNFDYAGNNNFQAINSDYRPGGIYGRFDAGSASVLGNAVTTANGAIANFNGSSNGLSNRIIWGVGVKTTPSALNKLTVGVAYYKYAFHRVAPSTVAGALTTKTSRNIGSEVNVTGEWKHSENVSLKATAGTFKPGAYVTDLRGANAALNPAVMLAGDVAIKF
ncbi:MAG: hypothetical protein ABL955_11575, partial [Elusimicrobiota bacterium]